MKEIFRPEFLNRVDEIIVFEELTKSHLSQILDIMLKQVIENIAVQGMSLSFDDKAKDFLIEKVMTRNSGQGLLERLYKGMSRMSFPSFICQEKLKRKHYSCYFRGGQDKHDSCGYPGFGGSKKTSVIIFKN